MPDHSARAAARGTPHSTSEQGAERNRLLRALPPEEYARLRPHLEPFEAEVMQIITEPGEPIRHAIFPRRGIISLLTRLADGSLIENATVGLEGMAGLPLALGVEWSPSLIAGEVPGECLRIEAAVFRELLPSLPGLGELLGRYAAYLFGQTAQSVACNGFHTIEQRCARWLLMTQDRVGAEFVLTHEILAQMLAVRRAGVTEAAGALQRAGLIAYSRGRMRILDRPGLERVACECHQQVRAQLDQLLGPIP